ncbi:MAG: DinB family protein [Dehalococcoidia bacterium]|nr:DinB family protein [Dehalococcoidia bacterium]
MVPLEVTIRDFIEEALATAWDNLNKATIGLTIEQLAWRPSPQANSIGYTLWHIGRVEDNFIQRFITRVDEVWAAGGWQERFGYETRGIGTGFTVEETGQVPVASIDTLWGYLNEVRGRTLGYMKELDWAALTDKPRADRFPEWSIQTILRQLIAHSIQHLGEINYIRGLMGLEGALG